jgi:peptidoglycan/xylan/chitin deacetylase (PgdA/CDA1 family)
MQGTISTRPERTGEEIAADRKEANAFFASVYTGWIGRRDLQRMIAYHSYAENLVQATMESESWWRSYSLSTAQRRARTAELHALVTIMDTPDPNAFRYYVPAANRALLPAPSVHPRPRTTRGRMERSQDLATGRSWFATLDRSVEEGSARVARIMREKDASFNLWLLNPRNWRYGPARAVDATEYVLPREGRYRANTIRPAGLSLDRAAQIAAAVLEQQADGH